MQGEEPVSPAEFAAKIKSKYPQYQDMDDLELAQKIVTKYPQYKDMVNFDGERSLFGVIPYLGEAIHYGGKNVENVATNMVPEQIATIRLQGNSAREKELAHLQGMMQSNPDSFSESQIAGVEGDLSATKQRLPEIEKEIQTQKAESATKLSGSVQNLTDVHNVTSFMNWFGSSLGQAGGQIPTSILTGGVSSFVMEAAEVYDTQLDLLAEKHGISREEVVKRGLDKPAEGQAYALVAGAMDAISAGKVMGVFKNIAKQGAKNLAKQGVKQSIFKEAVKDGISEFFTEGAQGQLEKFGGAAGAGTEAHFDLKQFLNEGAAGLVGGVGVGLGSQGLENKLTKHPSQEVIDAHDDLHNNIDTGNPELNQNIDDIAKGSAIYIDKLFDDVRAITGEVEGGKLREEQDKLIKSGLETYKKLADEEDRVKRQGIIADMLKEFEQSPTVAPEAHPASEENELGPQVDTIEYNKLHPQPFTTQDTTVPSIDEQGNDIQKPAKQFQFKDFAGEASGTIVADAANIDKIYAAQDAQGNPIKGGNLYTRVINKLKENGINTLVVGAQSPATQAVLKKLTEKGTIRVLPEGNVTIGDNTYNTRFSLNPVKQNDTQNKEGLQSGLGEGQKPLVGQPVKGPSSKKAATSGVLQTPQAVKKGRTENKQLTESIKESENSFISEIKNRYKLPNKVGPNHTGYNSEDQNSLIAANEEGKLIDYNRDRDKRIEAQKYLDLAEKEIGKTAGITKKSIDTLREYYKVEGGYFGQKEKTRLESELRKQAEDKESKEIALHAQIDNAIKRPPSRVITALESIAEKADKLGLKEVADRASKEVDKQLKLQEQKSEDREIRKAAREKEIANRKTKEERAEERKVEKEAKATKNAAKKVNQPVEGTSVQKGVRAARPATINETKEALLKEIAYQRHTGNPNYTKVAEKYIKFREKNNLKPQTMEQVMAKSKLTHYEEYAKKQAEKESRERGSVIRRIAELRKEGASVEELSRKEQELKDQIKGELAKMLGVKQSDINDISFTNLHNISEKILSDLDVQVNKKDVRPYTVLELLNRFTNHTSFRSPFTKQLLLAVNKIVKDRGKEFKIIVANTPVNFGSYVTGKNMEVLFLTEGALNAGKDESTVLHEILHGYTGVLANTIYKNNPAFAAEVKKLYDSAKTNLRSKLNVITKKLVNSIKTLPESERQDVPMFSFAKEHLTQEEFNIFASTLSYIDSFYGNNKNTFTDTFNKLSILANHGEGVLKRNTTFSENDLNMSFKLESGAKLDAFDLVFANRLYGFRNQQEFLSEALSDPALANLLHQLSFEGQSVRFNSKGNKTNTILQGLLSAIRKVIEKASGYYQKAFEGSSHFDELEEVMGKFDELFQEEYQNYTAYDPHFRLPSIGDLRNSYPNETLKDVKKFLALTAESWIESGPTAFNFDFKLPKKLKVPDINKKIITKLSRTLERRAEIKSLKDVQDYIDRVNKNLPITKQLGSTYAEDVLKAIQRLRKKRTELSKTYIDAIDRALKNPLYKTSREFEMTTDDFNKVDLSVLNIEQLTQVTRGIEALARNQMVQPSAYNVMITYGKALTKKRELITLDGKIDKNISSIASDFSNPSSFASIVGRYNKSSAHKILKNIYSGLMQTYSNISTESQNLFLDLNKIADKGGLTHSNLAKVGIYGSIFSTKSDPANTVEWIKEVMENAQFAVESTAQKIKAKEKKKYNGSLKMSQIEQEHEIAKKIYTQLEKNPSMDGILSPVEKRLYDKFREFASAHETGFARNSIATWGNKGYEARFNYFPTLAQGKTNTKSQDDFDQDELLSNSAQNLMTALGQESNKDKNELYGKKVWSNYRRLNPKGYFYEFDALAISQKWSKKMLFDLYASTELKALNRLMKDQEFVDAMGEGTVDGFRKQLKSIAGAGYKFSDDMNIIGKAALSARDHLYTAVLATTGQVLSQSSSGFAAATIISANAGLKAPQIMGKAIAATFRSMEYPWYTGKLQAWLQENGMGIQLRDILFEKYLSPQDYESYSRKKFQSGVNVIQNAAEWGLRAGDKLGARIVWFAAYFNAGGTLENPNKEAVLEAERWVGMMQNMSDINFTAPGFKYDTAWKKIVMGMLYAYKSFAINSYTNILYSSRNALHSRDARVVAIGQLASIVAYHAMAICAVKPLYEAVTGALLGGDDDDEDKKKYSKVDEIIASSLWDIGAMPLPAIGDSFARYIFNKTVAPRIYGGDPWEPFDQYTQSPIYSHKTQDDIWKDIAGPGGKELVQAMMDGSSLLVYATQAHDYFEDVDKLEQEKYEAQLVALSLANTIASSMIPLGDIKKVVDMAVRKKRAQYLKDKKEGSGNGGSLEGEAPDENPEPEFVEKEYELNKDINQ